MARIRKKTGFVRTINIAIAVIFQIAILISLVMFLETYAVFAYAILEIIALVAVFEMAQSNQSSSYTYVWTVVILLFPVLGIILHFLWSNSYSHGPRSKGIREALEIKKELLYQEQSVMDSLEAESFSRLRIAKYLLSNGFPIYNRTKLKYYSLGEEQFKDMIEDMKHAESFIFIEYFIMDTGDLWDRVFEVISEKAMEGVDVRILYDDVGSIRTLPENFKESMKKHGIKAVAFNPAYRYIARMHLNYRNHQKITVIDGVIGYTGGTNLADEYANIYDRFGHWKDTAIRLEGDSVWSLTIIFLKMWQTESGEKEDYNHFAPRYDCESSGYVQPFADGPHNNPKNPAETLYKMIIANAQRYVYITTPYLIVESSMIELLVMAAASGVDVRIITPSIPDKWYVHIVTRSNYGRLLEAGVRIFEYKPGYIHSKMIISDDDNGVVGSINMDYRSFNLHFENGIWMQSAPIIEEIRVDIEKTIDISEEITLEKWNTRSILDKLKEVILRFFSPLM